jgi:hypothetical protein
MPATLLDRFTPTEILLVSRGWVIDAVEAVEGADDAQRARWVEELIAYNPPRRNGLRNNFIVWTVALGAAMVADAMGFRPWTGFVAAILVFLRIGRSLAVRTLRWRLDQLRAGREADAVHSGG